MPRAIVDYRSVSWILGAFAGVLALCMLLPLGYDIAIHRGLPDHLLKALAATAAAAAARTARRTGSSF